MRSIEFAQWSSWRLTPEGRPYWAREAWWRVLNLLQPRLLLQKLALPDSMLNAKYCIHQEAACIAGKGRLTEFLGANDTDLQSLQAPSIFFTSLRVCVQAGMRILQQGGTAADAAVATAAALNVTEPCSTGIIACPQKTFHSSTFRASFSWRF